MRGSRAHCALVTLLLLAHPLPAGADQQPQPSATLNAAHLNARLHATTPPTLPPSIRIPKLPTTVLHSEFVVETNKKGQVARVRSGKASSNPKFNIMTYGNALQTFIRTVSGRAVAGTFRLTYDYSPTTKMVVRHVALIHSGGVNPNAMGAVGQMTELVRKHVKPASKASPKPH